MNITKMIKAQELSLEDQLAAGVRMFDVRPSASGSSVQDLPIQHGIAPLGDPSLRRLRARRDRPAGALALYAFAVLDRFVRFLEAHPGRRYWYI